VSRGRRSGTADRTTSVSALTTLLTKRRRGTSDVHRPRPSRAGAGPRRGLQPSSVACAQRLCAPITNVQKGRRSAGREPGPGEPRPSVASSGPSGAPVGGGIRVKARSHPLPTWPARRGDRCRTAAG
jgi:hypothetical protein